MLALPRLSLYLAWLDYLYTVSLSLVSRVFTFKVGTKSKEKWLLPSSIQPRSTYVSVQDQAQDQAHRIRGSPHPHPLSSPRQHIWTIPNPCTAVYGSERDWMEPLYFISSLDWIVSHILTICGSLRRFDTLWQESGLIGSIEWSRDPMTATSETMI